MACSATSLSKTASAPPIAPPLTCCCWTSCPFEVGPALQDTFCWAFCPDELDPAPPDAISSFGRKSFASSSLEQVRLITCEIGGCTMMVDVAFLFWSLEEECLTFTFLRPATRKSVASLVRQSLSGLELDPSCLTNRSDTNLQTTLMCFRPRMLCASNEDSTKRMISSFDFLSRLCLADQLPPPSAASSGPYRCSA